MLRLIACFMFPRSRRKDLIERSWKALPRDNDSLRMWGRALLRQLNDDQLELFLKIVELRGAKMTECVLMHSGASLNDTPLNVLFCKVWRWPDLIAEQNLKKLSWCASGVYPCVNPYHWSRIYHTEPPNVIEESADVKDIASKQSDFRGESLTTGGTNQCLTGPLPWCQLAYWEGSCRVGRLVAVHRDWYHVFSGVQQEEGMCLATLAAARGGAGDRRVLRVRKKIGQGFTISREEDGVWLYNRSQANLFVNSPALNRPPERTSVYKLFPGYSIKIHDYHHAGHAGRRPWPSPTLQTRDFDGPRNYNSVRVSFAKGWGPNYTRRDVLSCPCWMEIILNPAPPPCR